jgi:hypothetical protein
MLFWIREILGWSLVVVSLFLVQTSLGYVSNRQVVEGGVVALISIGVLRAGILVVRMSTAARIASR